MACCSAPCGPHEKDPYKDHGMVPASARKCRDLLCLLVFIVFCKLVQPFERVVRGRKTMRKATTATRW